MQFIKMKTSRKPCFQCPNSHATDNWHDTYVWYIGSTLVVTYSTRGNEWCSRVSESETLHLHCAGWSGGSSLDANLISSALSLNHGNPGHSEQQFLLWCDSSTVKRGQQQNNTHILVIYKSIISVLKEEAAQPSKCQSFLPPWYTATVKRLCSEELKKPNT